VLLVEDNPADARLVGILLDEADPGGFEVSRCGRLEEALALLESGRPGFDVVLLDLSLPDSAGLETVERTRARAAGTPVVVLSGRDDEETALSALRGGAEDYLIKGRGDGELMARVIRYAIERAKAEAELNYLARYDPLTGLANRALLADRLEQALIRGGREGSVVALAILDVDRFESVNDSLGHAGGDELLVRIAQRIRGRVREGDTVARVGVDEFAILLEDLADEREVVPLVRRVQEALADPFALNGGEVFVTAGMGISVSPPSKAGAMLRDAEAALRRAKRRRSGGYEFYTPEMNARVSESFALEVALRRALLDPDGAFEVHYQPQVDLRAGEVVGAEALLRWRRPGSPGLVPPNEFIPVLENMGGISAVGEWVMREACRQARVWREAGGRPLRVAVNVSAPQFAPSLVETVSRVLGETGSLLLELEITESLLGEDPEGSTRVLEELKALGTLPDGGAVRVAIDDFGTGYSSLDRLATFPIDLLKVDRSFVRDVTKVAKRAAIAAVIVELAHRLDLEVMAEGVETLEQLDFLRAEGCDLAQGYLFGRPLPATEFAALLQEGVPFPGTEPQQSPN
jgi:diguanylate cyclase (GGDEF)-like protein